MSGEIPSWARVGAKVVCVDNGPIRVGCLVHEPDVKPHIGVVYTIRKCFVDADGEPVVFLREIRRPRSLRWGRWFLRETPYLAVRFRPVVSDETEATIFRHLRQPRKIEVEA